MADSYLDIAVKVFRNHQQPLRARQILRLASEMDIIPNHLYGHTQYKTLHARLSENVLHFGTRSAFFRTGPGEFFLRELQNQQSCEADYREWYAKRRKKELGHEWILTIPKQVLDDNQLSGLVEDIHSIFDLLAQHARYEERRLAELDETVKQFVTYVIISKGNSVLSYRRGKFSNATDEIKGARSIGFGGHVTEHDADFLDNGMYGIRNNAMREMLEELHLEPSETRRLHERQALHLMSFLNVDQTADAKKHVAAVIFYFCSQEFEPKKGELSINDLSWINLSHKQNNIDDFELWSKILIEKMGDINFRQKIEKLSQLAN